MIWHTLIRMSDVIDWCTLAEAPLGGTLEDLEASLRKDSQNLRARVQLIRHYLNNLFSPEAQARRHEHIYWLVSNHPEIRLGGWATINRDGWPEAYDEGKRLWISVISARADDPAILRNATEFLFVYDRALAEGLIRRGVALDPSDSYWHESLGFLRHSDWYDASCEDRRRAAAHAAMGHYAEAIALESSPRKRHGLVSELARVASKAGDHDRAAEAATVVLSEATVLGDSSSAHDAHMVLGNCALARGDLVRAREHLAAATSMNVEFAAGEILGPDFTLATALLAHGEGAAVIDYLDACKRWWPYRNHLENWRRQIERGETPAFRLVKGQAP